MVKKEIVMQIKEFKPGDFPDPDANGGKRYVHAVSRANGWIKGFQETKTNKILDVSVVPVRLHGGTDEVRAFVKYQMEVKENEPAKETTK